MAFKKGHVPWNTGKKCPQLSKIQKERWEMGVGNGFKKGHHGYRKDYTVSEETKTKISHALKGRKCPWVAKANRKKSGENHYAYGKRRPEISGERNNNWKGGITSLKKLIRGLPEYKRWRKSIFEESDYTCKICNTRGCVLHADHYPVSFAEIVIKFKLSTLAEAIACSDLWGAKGRTLCLACHKETDNYFWKGAHKC